MAESPTKLLQDAQACETRGVWREPFVHRFKGNHRRKSAWLNRRQGTQVRVSLIWARP